MQQFIKTHGIKLWGILCGLFTGIAVKAQDKIEINADQVESWFERNWMWVAAGVILLLLIVLFGRNKSSSARRKTTTVVKDADGRTKSVTTTEENV
jgi:hypothetical protein